MKKTGKITGYRMVQKIERNQIVIKFGEISEKDDIFSVEEK